MRSARAVTLAVIACAFAGVATASAPPVGPLPKGPTTTIATTRGALVSVALPGASSASGLVWRVARPFDGKVMKLVSEGNVGTSVLLVFRAVGRGHTTLVFAQTRGETAKALRAARYSVTVR